MIKIDSSNFEFNVSKIIEMLNKIDVDFLVVGGVLLQGYLGDHARNSDDLDFVYDCEFALIEKRFKQIFDVKDFLIVKPEAPYYENGFCAKVNLDGKMIQIEGIASHHFKGFKPVEYLIDDIKFKGAPIELVIAYKVVYNITDLKKPYKHLFDLYAFSQLNDHSIDLKEIKRFVELIYKYENAKRKELNIPVQQIEYKIKDNKEYTKSYVLSMFASGFNVVKEEVIDEVNKYLEKIKNS